MATISVGNIKFNWKGAWSSSTTYAVDDVVSLSGSSYISIQAGSNQNPASASAYWQQMSSAGTNGTNGTDVGTVITTQGDMLYRDGSGLQRLAKGTAAQELRMNSGATAPEWHTPAVATSDFVKIGTVETTSNVSSVDIQGCFTTAYDFYIVKYGMLNGSGNYYFEPTWLKSNNSPDTTEMRAKYNEVYGNYSTATAGVGTQNDTDGIRIMNTWYQNDNCYWAHGSIEVNDPLLTHAPKHFWSQSCYYSYGDNAASHIGHDIGVGYQNSSNTHTGIRFRMNGGTIQTGFRATVYGLKN